MVCTRGSCQSLKVLEFFQIFKALKVLEFGFLKLWLHVEMKLF